MKEARSIRVSPGNPLPIGVRDCCDGFNFAVFSRHASRVALVLYEDGDADGPTHVIDLDPDRHRTGDIWHVLVDGIGWGMTYTFRVAGPWTPDAGHRFDFRRLLLDPCANAVVGSSRSDFSLLVSTGDMSHSASVPFPEPYDAAAPRAVLVNRRFDWQGDGRPRRSWSETVIYETHIRGLTIHPSSGVSAPGTFLGLIEKIPHFLELGITAVELMPVHEFNEHDLDRVNPATGETLRDYWGYSTMAFCAPKEGYSTGMTAGCQVDEFKTMVRALHHAGIEILLDVVFNHTAEGNESGPTISFRGFDNAIYYMLSDGGRGYKNYSGCGNTLNCNHPVVRDFVVDCLRYWATEMRVDGFRFDLASILGRDEEGRLMENAPLLERIAEDPVLRDVKLIAEAWDAGGAYQVGSFPGHRWAEWNARFRDDVRRFWRGDAGMTGALASRLCGSADLYRRTGKEPINSVNFITCHDGLTLNDLVSYERKHNEANGEDSRDGAVENFSANYGVEGPTDNPSVEALRMRLIKNMLATVLLSRGVPMLLGGDEFRRSQRGNNNAYCQDNELSWYDWRLLDRNREIARFVREMIAFRKRNPALVAEEFFEQGDIEWFGTSGRPPDWDGPTRALGCFMRPGRTNDGRAQGTGLCLLFNAAPASVEFFLPAEPAAGWRLSIDTGSEAPRDVFSDEEGPRISGGHPYQVGPQSLAILSTV